MVLNELAKALRRIPGGVFDDTVKGLAMRNLLRGILLSWGVFFLGRLILYGDAGGREVSGSAAVMFWIMVLSPALMALYAMLMQAEMGFIGFGDCLKLIGEYKSAAFKYDNEQYNKIDFDTFPVNHVVDLAPPHEGMQAGGREGVLRLVGSIFSKCLKPRSPLFLDRKLRPGLTPKQISQAVRALRFGAWLVCPNTRKTLNGFLGGIIMIAATVYGPQFSLLYTMGSLLCLALFLYGFFHMVHSFIAVT